jgi:hypothetical protein
MQTNIIISNLEAKLELEEKKVVVINYLIRKKNDETGIVKIMSRSILDAITPRKRSRLSDEDEDACCKMMKAYYLETFCDSIMMILI